MAPDRDILAEIFARKALDLDAARRAVPLAEMAARARAAAPALDFIQALRAAAPTGRPALIAEIKAASPSRGQIARDFDPLGLARTYQANGARAISILTEEHYFKGSLHILRAAAGLTPRLPLLRKDFLSDPYQIYEARAAGADAVLLIAAYLQPAQLAELHALAREIGMAALVEVHSAPELEMALQSCDPPLLGINNRDLRDFTVRLETSLALRPLVPAGKLVVAESGIHTRADVDRLAAAGVGAILVGEALVAAADTAEQVRSLAG
jgi:indole-3-glycerol phosphate synthase